LGYNNYWANADKAKHVELRGKFSLASEEEMIHQDVDMDFK
jgi:hypothetical protein